MNVTLLNLLYVRLLLWTETFSTTFRRRIPHCTGFQNSELLHSMYHVKEDWLIFNSLLSLCLLFTVKIGHFS